MTELRHPKEIALVAKTHQTICRLETEINTVTRGQGYKDTEYRLMHSFGWKLKQLFAEWKSQVFDQAWQATRYACGLANVKDDEGLKEKLKKQFVDGSGLDYTPVTEYFEGLAGMADKLALAQIRLEARRSLPDGGYERVQPKDGETPLDSQLWMVEHRGMWNRVDGLDE